MIEPRKMLGVLVVLVARFYSAIFLSISLLHRSWGEIFSLPIK